MNAMPEVTWFDDLNDPDARTWLDVGREHDDVWDAVIHARRGGHEQSFRATGNSCGRNLLRQDVVNMRPV